jgi:hypothetical protein
MSTQVVEIGDKLHIMTRRFFDDDIRRNFVGEMIGLSAHLVELRGYTFIFHSGLNDYRRLPEIRKRLFSLGEAGHVVNKIPRDVDVETVGYRIVDKRLVVSDGKSFHLPINEFGSTN